MQSVATRSSRSALLKDSKNCEPRSRLSTGSFAVPRLSARYVNSKNLTESKNTATSLVSQQENECDDDEERYSEFDNEEDQFLVSDRLAIALKKSIPNPRRSVPSSSLLAENQMKTDNRQHTITKNNNTSKAAAAADTPFLNSGTLSQLDAKARRAKIMAYGNNLRSKTWNPKEISSSTTQSLNDVPPRSSVLSEVFVTKVFGAGDENDNNSRAYSPTVESKQAATVENLATGPAQREFEHPPLEKIDYDELPRPPMNINAALLMPAPPKRQVISSSLIHVPARKPQTAQVLLNEKKLKKPSSGSMSSRKIKKAVPSTQRLSKKHQHNLNETKPAEIMKESSKKPVGQTGLRGKSASQFASIRFPSREGDERIGFKNVQNKPASEEKNNFDFAEELLDEEILDVDLDYEPINREILLPRATFLPNDREMEEEEEEAEEEEAEEIDSELAGLVEIPEIRLSLSDRLQGLFKAGNFQAPSGKKARYAEERLSRDSPAPPASAPVAVSASAALPSNTSIEPSKERGFPAVELKPRTEDIPKSKRGSSVSLLESRADRFEQKPVENRGVEEISDPVYEEEKRRVADIFSGLRNRSAEHSMSSNYFDHLLLNSRIHASRNRKLIDSSSDVESSGDSADEYEDKYGVVQTALKVLNHKEKMAQKQLQKQKSKLTYDEPINYSHLDEKRELSSVSVEFASNVSPEAQRLIKETMDVLNSAKANSSNDRVSDDPSPRIVEQSDAIYSHLDEIINQSLHYQPTHERQTNKDRPFKLRQQLMTELEKQDKLFQYTLELQDLQLQTGAQAIPTIIYNETSRATGRRTKDEIALNEIEERLSKTHDNLASTEQVISESERLLDLYYKLQQNEAFLEKQEAEASHRALLDNLQAIPLVDQTERLISLRQSSSLKPSSSDSQRQTEEIQTHASYTPYYEHESKEKGTQMSPQKASTHSVSIATSPAARYQDATPVRSARESPVRSLKVDTAISPMRILPEASLDPHQRRQLRINLVTQKQKERLAWLDHVIRLHLISPSEAEEERQKFDLVYQLEIERLRSHEDEAKPVKQSSALLSKFLDSQRESTRYGDDNILIPGFWEQEMKTSDLLHRATTPSVAGGSPSDFISNKIDIQTRDLSSSPSAEDEVDHTDASPRDFYRESSDDEVPLPAARADLQEVNDSVVIDQSNYSDASADADEDDRVVTDDYEYDYDKTEGVDSDDDFKVENASKSSEANETEDAIYSQYFERSETGKPLIDHSAVDMEQSYDSYDQSNFESMNASLQSKVNLGNKVVVHESVIDEGVDADDALADQTSIVDEVETVPSAQRSRSSTSDIVEFEEYEEGGGYDASANQFQDTEIEEEPEEDAEVYSDYGSSAGTDSVDQLQGEADASQFASQDSKPAPPHQPLGEDTYYSSDEFDRIDQSTSLSRNRTEQALPTLPSETAASATQPAIAKAPEPVAVSQLDISDSEIDEEIEEIVEEEDDDEEEDKLDATAESSYQASPRPAQTVASLTAALPSADETNAYEDDFTVDQVETSALVQEEELDQSAAPAVISKSADDYEDEFDRIEEEESASLAIKPASESQLDEYDDSFLPPQELSSVENRKAADLGDDQLNDYEESFVPASESEVALAKPTPSPSLMPSGASEPQASQLDEVDEVIEEIESELEEEEEEETEEKDLDDSKLISQDTKSEAISALYSPTSTPKEPAEVDQLDQEEKEQDEQEDEDQLGQEGPNYSNDFEDSSIGPDKSRIEVSNIVIPPSNMYFDMDAQRWVGDDEVSMAGFEETPPAVTPTNANPEYVTPNGLGVYKKGLDATPGGARVREMEVIDEAHEIEDDLDISVSDTVGAKASLQLQYFHVSDPLPSAPVHALKSKSLEDYSEDIDDVLNELEDVLGELDVEDVGDVGAGHSRDFSGEVDESLDISTATFEGAKAVHQENYFKISDPKLPLTVPLKEEKSHTALDSDMDEEIERVVGELVAESVCAVQTIFSEHSVNNVPTSSLRISTTEEDVATIDASVLKPGMEQQLVADSSLAVAEETGADSPSQQLLTSQIDKLMLAMDPEAVVSRLEDPGHQGELLLECSDWTLKWPMGAIKARAEEILSSIHSQWHLKPSAAGLDDFSLETRLLQLAGAKARGAILASIVRRRLEQDSEGNRDRTGPRHLDALDQRLALRLKAACELELESACDEITQAILLQSIVNSIAYCDEYL